MALQQSNVEVDVAESVAEAKRLIGIFGKQYCCVLVDLTLPDGSGEDVVRESYDTMPDLPVIIVTGKSVDEVMPIANDFVTVKFVIRKPVDPSVLRAAVHGPCVRLLHAPAAC